MFRVKKEEKANNLGYIESIEEKIKDERKRLKEEGEIIYRNCYKLTKEEIQYIENEKRYINEWNSIEYYAQTDKYLSDRESYPLLMNLFIKDVEIILDNLDFCKIKTEIKKYFSIDVDLDGDYNEIRIRRKKLDYYNIVINKDFESKNLLIINAHKNKISLRQNTIWKRK